MTILLAVLGYIVVGLVVARVMLYFGIPDSDDAIYLGSFVVGWPLVVVIMVPCGVMYFLGRALRAIGEVR